MGEMYDRKMCEKARLVDPNKYTEIIKSGGEMKWRCIPSRPPPAPPPPTNEMLKERNERTIIYRPYSVETRRIEKMTVVRVEKALKPIWEGISYVARGKKYGTVKVRFREAATARLLSATPLRTNEMMLLPVYLGRRASRIREEDIPPKVDVAWMVAAILLGMTENLVVR